MRLITLVLVGLIGSTATGCRWFDRARAEEHDRRAKEAAKSLNIGEAIDEHGKAEEARRAAKKDPLP